MIRVYLSGAITGRKESEWRAQFNRAAEHYKSCGYEVVNPVEISDKLGKNKSWEEYMKADLKALKKCTHIAMLSGWEGSKGANVELAEAKKLNLEIMGYKDYGC